MNERIKELAVQANVNPMYSSQGFAPRYIFEEEEFEKFSELIVRECCSAIRLDDVFNGGKFQRIILEHFGVEE
jgi:hypothetical protein